MLVFKAELGVELFMILGGKVGNVMFVPNILRHKNKNFTGWGFAWKHTNPCSKRAGEGAARC